MSSFLFVLFFCFFHFACFCFVVFVVFAGCFIAVAIDSGDVIVISASVPVKELNDTVIGKESAYLELLFADSSGLDFNEVTINIVSVGIKTSTVAETCNATIVSGINYEVISEDSSTYTLVRRSLDTGSFFDSYDAGLMNVFPQRVAICDELVRNASDIIESYEEMSYDEAFPPDADPTITEELWSEYLFFGFFTSLLGVVWLWYLRSDVDDGNVYVDNGANGGNTGIEMQPKQPPKGTNVASDSSNALLTDGAPQDTKLSDYAVQSEDGKLVLDQRDSKRSP